MRIKQLKKEIKSTFLPPIRKYYFGRIKYHTPYFEPIGFHSSIISFRKLKRLSEERLEGNRKRRYIPTIGVGWAKEKYSNMPIVRRSKNFIVKLLGNEYYVRIGKPWAVVKNELGWKDKYNTPRYEWEPSFQVWFFKWQFCIHWMPPSIEGDDSRYPDLYWEMILWYLNYCDKDLEKAEKEWGWQDYKTKESTWNKKYLI